MTTLISEQSQALLQHSGGGRKEQLLQRARSRQACFELKAGGVEGVDLSVKVIV